MYCIVWPVKIVAFAGVTVIEVNFTDLRFKAAAPQACEHKNGSGVLLPGPFVLHTSGPPLILSGSALGSTNNDRKQEKPGCKVKGFEQVPGATI